MASGGMTARLFATWLAALALLGVLASAPSARAQTSDCAVVLDASGSMRGYAPDGGGSTLGRILSELNGACSGRFAFGDRFREWDGQVGPRTFSDINTRLGAALAAWRQRSPNGVAVFVTDNVADSGRGNSDQDAFYRALQSPPPGYAFVSVVITRLNFNGRVFPIGNGRGAAYRGPRALTFYVLAPTSRSRGRAALEALEQALQHAGLTRGGRPDARGYTVVMLAPLALVQQQRVPIRLSGANGAQPMPDGQGVLVNPASASAQPEFTIEVTPRFSSDWRAREIQLSSELRFAASDEFGAASTTACVTQPDRLTAASLNRPVVITCRPAALGESLTAEQRRALEARGTSYREGRLVLLATVDQSALEMAGALRGWTYSGSAASLGDPQASVQGGVYNLGTLLTRMIPQRRITAEIAETRVVQRIWLIDPVHWAQAIAGLLVVALLVFLGFLAIRKREYEFTGDKSSPTFNRPLRFGEAVFLEPVEGGLVQVRVLVFGFFISSNGRDPVKPSFLSARGGRFSVGRDGSKMSVRPVRASRESKRDQRGGGGRSNRRRTGGSRR
jgi:hypothetical protein